MASKCTKTHVTTIPFTAGNWDIELQIIGHISHLKYHSCKTEVCTRISFDNWVTTIIFITKKDPTARVTYMVILKK